MKNKYCGIQQAIACLQVMRRLVRLLSMLGVEKRAIDLLNIPYSRRSKRN
ncbi:MAG: hypothetical protein RMY34_18775 [Aulosira sp. DedQUE10]|nr:hypothetical protein [Aulosira sp. DedQUE10]